MITFILATSLIVVAFGAVLIALTAMDRADETYARLGALESELSDLRKHVRGLRREAAGYPPEPVVAHRRADVYDLPHHRGGPVTGIYHVGDHGPELRKPA